MAATQARIVVIGGGAVGVCALYHLARMGEPDALLLERDELTAGSTWHAAGNCPNFAADPGLMRLQAHGTALYRGLAEEVGYPIDYHVTGSVRLAHGAERMRELAHVAAIARAQGLAFDLLSPAELRERHPLMETHDLAGGLWDPLDGDIDPAQLTQALARGARGAGARIERGRPVTGIGREGGEWVVETPGGEVRCEVVVNAAGFHARRVGGWLVPHGGREPPMTVLQHQYLLTGEDAEILAHERETGRRLPILRDVDVSYYLRQEKGGLNLGPYERACRGAWDGPGEEIPEGFAFQLFPDDLDRLAPYIEDAVRRVPALGRAGVERVVNGPIPYTPDGLPLIGPSPGVRGAFEACVFSFGIVQAGGAGRALAEWVLEGGTEHDLRACDPRRFGGFADRAYAAAKGREVYAHEYAVRFPRREWPAARGLRRSALHGRLAEAGAVFGAVHGWERALWFARPGDPDPEALSATWGRPAAWAGRVEAECRAVAEGCGVCAIPGFGRWRLRGEGARAWLDRLVATRLPAPGRVALAYAADERGRIATEWTVVAEGRDDLLLIGAAPAERFDRDLLADRPAGVTLADETEGAEALLVTGPLARDRLAPLADADLALPFMSRQDARVAGRPATLLRLSFAGELGWEVHAAPSDMPAIWDALTAAGVRPFGMHALDALRLEKGFLAWNREIRPDPTLLELGLERLVDWEKPFRGDGALRAERERGVARRLVALRLDPAARDGGPARAAPSCEGRDPAPAAWPGPIPGARSGATPDPIRAAGSGPAPDPIPAAPPGPTSGARSDLATADPVPAAAPGSDADPRSHAAPDAPPDAPVREGGRIVGAVTSGGWGHRVGGPLALALVEAAAAAPGTALSVDLLGERRPARVAETLAIHDPRHRRMRA